MDVHVVTSWNREEIVSLFRSEGWWDEEQDNPAEIGDLIRGSLVFVVAVDRKTRKAIGMGRAISDGISDAYIQDLMVLPEYREKGIGTAILRLILEACRARGIRWIALIAEGGTGDFYRRFGFGVDEGDIPMVYRRRGEDSLT